MVVGICFSPHSLAPCFAVRGMLQPHFLLRKWGGGGGGGGRHGDAAGGSSFWAPCGGCPALLSFPCAAQGAVVAIMGLLPAGKGERDETVRKRTLYSAFPNTS